MDLKKALGLAFGWICIFILTVSAACSADAIITAQDEIEPETFFTISAENSIADHVAWIIPPGIKGRMMQCNEGAAKGEVVDSKIIRGFAPRSGRFVFVLIVSDADGIDYVSKEVRIKDGSSPCLLYTSPSPRDRTRSRMPSSA